MRLIFNLLKALKPTVVVLIMLHLSPAFAEGNPLPAHLDACVKKAVTELLITDGSNRQAASNLFKKHVDTEWLGKTSYKGFWKDANEEWKKEAVRQYFEFLFSKSRQVSGGAGLVDDSVESWLPTKKAERGGDGTKGFWHIVFRAKLDNGDSVNGAALVTDNCKFFDLAVGGVWIGGQMKAGFVDAAVRAKK